MLPADAQRKASSPLCVDSGAASRVGAHISECVFCGAGSCGDVWGAGAVWPPASGHGLERALWRIHHLHNPGKLLFLVLTAVGTKIGL